MRSWYQDPIHEPYSLTHDRDMVPGALLVHGFTGSPADMRAMAEVIHARGVDVHVMVLPGMAGDIHRLNDMTAGIWRDAVVERWRQIRAQYETALLAGYSMGGALSILAAAEVAPERLMLIAPLSRIADRRAWLLPIARYVLPHIKPYAGLDWTSERVHDWFDRTRPSMETRRPVNQRVLTNDAVYSTKMLNELRRLLVQMRRVAPQVSAPSLVVQGTEDRIVLPRHTRQLVGRLGGEVDYREIPGDHYLPLPDMGAWPRLRRMIDDDVAAWLRDVAPREASHAR